MSIFGTAQFVTHNNATVNPCTATVNTALGDMIIVSWSGVTAPTSVTDTIGNTYVLNAGAFAQNGFGTYQYMYYCLSSFAANAANVIQVNFGGNNSGTVSVWDVPISGGYVLFDSVSKAISNGATNPAVAAFSTTGTDEFVAIAVDSQTAVPSYAAGSGYTLDASVAGGGFITRVGCEHRTYSSVQSGITPGFTAASADYSIVALAIKAGPPSAFGTPVSVKAAMTFSVSAVISAPALNTALNDLILVAISNNGTAINSVTDTIGNQYIPAYVPLAEPGFSYTQVVWYCISSKGANASNVVTVTQAATAQCTISVTDVPVTGGWAALDGTATGRSATSTTGQTVTTLSINTDGPVDELIFGVTNSTNPNNTSFLAGAGATLDTTTPTTGQYGPVNLAVEHQRFSSVQTGISMSFSIPTGTISAAMGIVAFRAVYPLTTIQKASGISSIAATSLTVTLPAPTKAGSSIVVLFGSGLVGSTIGISDDKSNSYGAPLFRFNSGDNLQVIAAWIASPAIVGTQAITVTSNNSRICATVYELNGQVPLTMHNHATSLVGSATTVGPIAAAVGELLFFWSYCENQGGSTGFTPVAANGWPQIFDANLQNGNFVGMATHQIAPSSTNFTGNAGVPGAANYANAIMGIQAAFAISGNAGVAGALVSWTGTSSGSTTADGSGNYIIGVLNGTYTITPSLAGYTFSPTNSVQTVSGSSISGVNFTATATHSIFGNAGTCGATITYTGPSSGSVVANSSGDYVIPGLSGGTYTVTPSKTAYTFSPASRNVLVSLVDTTDINFFVILDPATGVVLTPVYVNTLTGPNANPADGVNLDASGLPQFAPFQVLSNVGEGTDNTKFAEGFYIGAAPIGNDQYAQVTVHNWVSDGGTALFLTVRVLNNQDIDNYALTVQDNGDGLTAGISVEAFVANLSVQTLYNNPSAPVPVNCDMFTLVAVGTSIALYRNRTQLFVATSTVHASGSVAISAETPSPAPLTNLTLTNLVFGNAAGLLPPVITGLNAPWVSPLIRSSIEKGNA